MYLPTPDPDLSIWIRIICTVKHFSLKNKQLKIINLKKLPVYYSFSKRLKIS